MDSTIRHRRPAVTGRFPDSAYYAHGHHPCGPCRPLEEVPCGNSAPSATPNKETYYDRLSKWTGKPVDATIRGRCNLSLPDAADGLVRPDRDSTGGTSSA
uniref:Uncharacterized protein n=1 Tax=Trichuris muris TaxID=70415 RepID=A0A5S6QP23_TRIMR